MTQKNGQEPENLKWMDIAENDAVNEVRHSRTRLPYVVAAIALVAVGGGSIFAQTNPLEPAQVTPTSVVTSVATALPTTGQQPTGQQVTTQQLTLTPPVATTGIPTIAPIAGGGYNGDDDDDEDDDEEEEEKDDDDEEDDEEDDD